MSITEYLNGGFRHPDDFSAEWGDRCFRAAREEGELALKRAETSRRASAVLVNASPHIIDRSASMIEGDILAQAWMMAPCVLELITRVHC